MHNMPYIYCYENIANEILGITDAFFSYVIGTSWLITLVDIHELVVRT
jgi:hypothetical protein